MRLIAAERPSETDSSSPRRLPAGTEYQSRRGTSVPFISLPASNTFVASGRNRPKPTEGVHMFQQIKDLISRDERGQGLAEYALILALIAVVVIAAVTLLGTNINSILSTIAVSI